MYAPHHYDSPDPAYEATADDRCTMCHDDYAQSDGLCNECADYCDGRLLGFQEHA